ncbi:hypothetical protein O181_019418 [Austropuccinia psidii MF-1]|uniref:Uncharacterized protein n=1 Tax=Austropuccinia psidii MF-1 TaxID=1389203 RepID=A0A9Q3C9L8_9BASI|nr:hypothetical protein [Austropuccinia psidii MF-1]
MSSRSLLSTMTKKCATPNSSTQPKPPTIRVDRGQKRNADNPVTCDDNTTPQRWQCGIGHRIGLGSLKGLQVTIDKIACIYYIIEMFSRGNTQDIKTKLHQKGSQMYVPTPSHKLTAQHVQA